VNERTDRGRFVSFEGGEGVGKTTQVKLLAQRLSNLNVKVQITREPGGGKIGELLRQILKQSSEIDPFCELLLIFAARRDHFVKFIQPWMGEGYIVLCDRFYDSSLVYQGLLRGIPIEDIMELKRITIGDFEPDLTIILDADIDVSISRIMERSSTNDRYDRMDRQEYSIIRRGFCQLAEIFSFRSVLINAKGSVNVVSSRIWKEFDKRIKFQPIINPPWLE
jgi:dTMP kinase